jgi:Formiminotransferase domain, N-terminal subdomain
MLHVPLQRASSTVNSSILPRASAVACNVYLSSASSALLLPLLDETHRRCSQWCHRLPPEKHSREIVSVVHAYADLVYDRSSFHLVGTAKAMADVVSQLAVDALQSLSTQSTPTTTDTHSLIQRHPFVGWVDHVAVMPLCRPGSEFEKMGMWTPSAWVARQVGTAMSNHNSGNLPHEISPTNICSVPPTVQVHYYGDAHPERIPLATVRREQTNFFRSCGLQTGPPTRELPSMATVGAPSSGFVENYNLRVRGTKKQAQTLTKRVRAELHGVEALTLPYAHGQWEVACNLLYPWNPRGTAEAIEEVADAWERDLMLESSGNYADLERFVIRRYRVGTTADRCWETLTKVGFSSHKQQTHYETVRRRFESSLNGTDFV